MTLNDKILTIYPEFKTVDYRSFFTLQNDGNGDYMVAWNHPTLPRPTDEQLVAIA